jgi:hypothetical protein
MMIESTGINLKVKDSWTNREQGKQITSEALLLEKEFKKMEVYV